MGIENERGGITRSGLLLLDLGESVDGDDANIYFLYLARPKYRRRTRRKVETILRSSFAILEGTRAMSRSDTTTSDRSRPTWRGRGVPRRRRRRERGRRGSWLTSRRRWWPSSTLSSPSHFHSYQVVGEIRERKNSLSAFSWITNSMRRRKKKPKPGPDPQVASFRFKLH